TSVDDATFYKITWGGNKFYASGKGGTILVADSGNTWRTYNVGVSADITSSVWRDSSLIALSYTNIFLSTTDSNWISINPGFTNLMLSIHYYDGTYFLIGKGGFIRYSSDAVNWTAPTINQ